MHNIVTPATGLHNPNGSTKNTDVDNLSIAKIMQTLSVPSRDQGMGGEQEGEHHDLWNWSGQEGTRGIATITADNGSRKRKVGGMHKSNASTSNAVLTSAVHKQQNRRQGGVSSALVMSLGVTKPGVQSSKCELLWIKVSLCVNESGSSLQRGAI